MRDGRPTSATFAIGFSPVFGESAASIPNGEVTPPHHWQFFFGYAVNTENPIIATVTSFTWKERYSSFFRFAAKHGVIGLSKAAAIEYASQGIRINALAPGLVETAMTRHWFDDPKIRAAFLANSPIGRVAQPEEMAGMVLFLCSDLASFAAGQTFVIDGGYTAR